MRRLKIEDSDVMQIAIQQEIVRSDESRYDHRLHGVLLVCAGMSCYDVAALFQHSPRTVQYWVTRFEHSGFEGLRDLDKPGRPASVTDEILEALANDLRRSPRDLGYPQNLWDGKLLSHHLTKTKNVRLGVRQCQRLFGNLGFRRRKPRPLIAKADPQVQAKYKKTATTGRKRRS
jgi:transposase